jgi:hypothetical protein
MTLIAKISVKEFQIKCEPRVFCDDELNYFIRESRCNPGTYMYLDKMWIISEAYLGYEIIVYSVLNNLIQSKSFYNENKTCGLKRRTSVPDLCAEKIIRTQEKIKDEITVLDTTLNFVIFIFQCTTSLIVKRQSV